ncbi:unnamed protein product [Polarella glacialis]|uniref:Uncharacterized protein n=1 Tax=Polarella glacialis TaxID=89957 RepID=A0A813KJC2_POLGL|nr:unnamed protein product [Polarella glacialis]
MASGEPEVQIIDGLPLIDSATKLKEEGNDCIKRKEYSKAVTAYENGIAMLDKADGKPMLRVEVEAMVALKAVLYCNMAQSLLSQELYRRAAEAASWCLSFDSDNTKALHRRSLALEQTRSYGPALQDVLALQRLGGGGVSLESLQARADSLREKKEAEEKEQQEMEDDRADDPIGMAMVHTKERFDEVVQKYDLKDGEAAGELADWLVSGEWNITPKRVAQRWNMEEEDAAVFLKWIQAGLDFKIRNAENQGVAQTIAPSLDV